MNTGNIGGPDVEDGHDLAIQDELCDVADEHNLDLRRDTGESNTSLAHRIIQALVDKFIDIDNTIHRVETLVPDAATEE